MQKYESEFSRTKSDIFKYARVLCTKQIININVRHIEGNIINISKDLNQIQFYSVCICVVHYNAAVENIKLQLMPNEYNKKK